MIDPLTGNSGSSPKWRNKKFLREKVSVTKKQQRQQDRNSSDKEDNKRRTIIRMGHFKFKTYRMNIKILKVNSKEKKEEKRPLKTKTKKFFI